MGKHKAQQPASSNSSVSNSFSALANVGEDAVQELTSTSRPTSGGAIKDGSAARLRLHDPLVWIDLEMTGELSETCHVSTLRGMSIEVVRYHTSGLDVDSCTIIEIACIVTDGDLAVQIEVRLLQIETGMGGHATYRRPGPSLL
jgi:hypothetical protein